MATREIQQLVRGRKVNPESWKFEDLKKTPGTGLGIFGLGQHPSVTICLEESNKPIRFLTGNDYVLHCLISEKVPELVMRYHSSGIVLKYEAVKPEDIPIAEHFDQDIVKDVVQNILSFLNSGCLTEGHTYWLFNNEISTDDQTEGEVLLYDLTSLCPENASFVYSVAMLLYKTAQRVTQRDSFMHISTIERLLKSCIELLNSQALSMLFVCSQNHEQVETSFTGAVSYLVFAHEILISNIRRNEDQQRTSLCEVMWNEALAFFKLAEQAFDVSKYGKALRHCGLALQCYGEFKQISSDQLDLDLARLPAFPLLPRILSLCGELHHLVVRHLRQHEAVTSLIEYEYATFSDLDLKIKGFIRQVLPGDEKYGPLAKLSSTIDQSLQLSKKCFEEALTVMDQYLPKKKTGKTLVSEQVTLEDLRVTLNRRFGHTVNELGAHALQEAEMLLNCEDFAKESVEEKCLRACIKAYGCFETARKIFMSDNDRVNQALTLSNMAKSFRIQAQLHINKDDSQSFKQQLECNTQAIEKYQEALSVMERNDTEQSCPPRLDTGVDNFKNIHHNICWDLSSCYFNNAQILQDNPPQKQPEFKEAEKKVISLLESSLKYCEDIWKRTPKRTDALYKQSKIYYRIGSLHHNASKKYLNGQECEQRRCLAETNYLKSLESLEGLKKPNDVIRVELERAAMHDPRLAKPQDAAHEQQPNQSGPDAIKGEVTALLEGLKIICNCIQPLQLLVRTTKLAMKTFHLQEDSKGQTVNAEMDIDETTNILCILKNAVLSFLLQLVKMSRTTGFEKVCSAALRKKKNKFKEVCDKALRGLQVLDEDSSKKNPQLFQRKLTAVLDVLRTTKSLVCGK